MVRPSRPEARSELSGRLLRQPARHWIHVLIASSEACGNDPTLRRSDTATTLNLNLNLNLSFSFSFSFSFRLGLEARRIQGSGSIERKTV